ncbi:uncharacterized protein LOC121367647 [Gigantopelta aegis]|uniref:uncharacterized protein LOC121367647 n=1 Tax=Gigantopelta aegis TaxID=1735272 RepID=UPI001B88A18E|nr:uncharacterized protein LOC121367647 [Gigantopelta aegis]
MVDLEDTLLVKEVTVFNRQDCCRERLHDFYVEVLKDPKETSPALCYHQVSAVEESASFVCPKPLEGRYVRIRKDNLLQKNDVLTLCEVEVKARKPVCQKEYDKIVETQLAKWCSSYFVRSLCRLTCAICRQGSPNCGDKHDRLCRYWPRRSRHDAQQVFCADATKRQTCSTICTIDFREETRY